MNTDKLIEEGCGKIDSRIEKLEELMTEYSSYSPKTNCRYGDSNIRTLDYQNLLKTYASIVREEIAWERTCRELGLEETLYLNGFSAKEWKEDVVHFLLIKKTSEELQTLTQKREALKNLYSNEKKTLTAVEELLKDV